MAGWVFSFFFFKNAVRSGSAAAHLPPHARAGEAALTGRITSWVQEEPGEEWGVFPTAAQAVSFT